MFAAAAEVLRRIGEDGRVINEFIELGARAKVAATEAMDTEETLGEIPDEFLDPIQVPSFSGSAAFFEFFSRSRFKIDSYYLITVHADEGSGDFTFFEDYCGPTRDSEASSQ